MARKIAVFMPVHNESLHIAKSIESVLSQDLGDFELLISENHSSDDTLEIVQSFVARDRRVILVKPDSKVNSYLNLRYLLDKVNAGSYEASVMLGGHDLIKNDYLSSLYSYMKDNPSCSIAYQRLSYEIDEQDKVTRLWPVCHQSGNLNASFDAVLTLLTLLYNTPIFGLWRQSVRRKTSFRYPCVGGDHLYVAEAALHGRIEAVAGSAIYLRRAPANANYLEKHFTESLGDEAAAKDMFVQLKWLSELVDESCAGYPPLAKELFRSSAVSLYLLRYNHHFSTFQSTLSAFVGRSDVGGLLQTQCALSESMKELLGRN
jgi:glycosyltransferase involved in cell wall biosynthesis